MLKPLLCVALAFVTTAPVTPVRSISITAREYAFDAPDTIVAGPTLVQLNNQGHELHHAYLVRLEDGKTASDLAAAMKSGGPPPAWMHDMGGPNAPAPGASTEAVVNFTPGNYILMCVIPSADGMMHAMKGMLHPITVVASKAGVAQQGSVEPMTDVAKPDVNITLQDYGFDIRQPITAGKHVIKVTNAAGQSHEILIAKLAPGKTPADLVAWVEKMDGPPPALPMGGLSPIASGESNEIVVTLEPGEYGLLCFVPDAKDGKPHVMHGMMRQITVK